MKAEVLNEWKNQKNLLEIGKSLSISRDRVRYILKKYSNDYDPMKNHLEYYKKEIIFLSKQNLTYKEIQNIMRKKYPNRNEKAINFTMFEISKKLKKWNIKRKKVLRHKTVEDPDFPFDQYNIKKLMATEFGQILIGTLMGDGCIHKTYYIFNISHCEKQKKYLEEKVRFLCLNMKIKLKSKAKKGFINGRVCNITNQYCAYTQMFPFLEKIRKDFYPDNKKIINFDYINHLNVLGLFIWFYDDGSFRLREKNGSEILLHIPCFKKQELNELVKILKNNFNLDKITLTKKNRLYFNKKSQVRLCELFIQNIPLSLLKSINQKYITILKILQNSSGDKSVNISGKGVRLG